MSWHDVAAEALPDLIVHVWLLSKAIWSAVQLTRLSVPLAAVRVTSTSAPGHHRRQMQAGASGEGCRQGAVEWDRIAGDLAQFHSSKSGMGIEWVATTSADTRPLSCLYVCSRIHSQP